jgi:hypothetical protein
MKKWAFAITVAFFALVSAGAAAVALTDDDTEADNGEPIARGARDGSESSGDGSGGGAAGICLEGTVDCIDMPTEEPPIGDDDVCIQIFPTPPECADPDAPVTNEPTPPGILEPGAPPSDPGQACTMEFPNKCTATAAAVADLAARLDLKEDAIIVVSVEAVEWPNACLGISQSDVACAEIITAGFRIFLEADGQKYDSHTDGGSRALLVD